MGASYPLNLTERQKASGNTVDEVLKNQPSGIMPAERVESGSGGTFFKDV